MNMSPGNNLFIVCKFVHREARQHMPGYLASSLNKGWEAILFYSLIDFWASQEVLSSLRALLAILTICQTVQCWRVVFYHLGPVEWRVSPDSLGPSRAVQPTSASASISVQLAHHCSSETWRLRWCSFRGFRELGSASSAIFFPPQVVALHLLGHVCPAD